jgi:sec-independent protein translocase protein TatB
MTKSVPRFLLKFTPTSHVEQRNVFDLFTPSHLLLIAIAVIVFIGPKDLPRFMRAVGKWTGKARAMAAEFQKSFEEMDRHEELRELREELTALRNTRPADFEATPRGQSPESQQAFERDQVAHDELVTEPMQAEMAPLS